MNFLCNTKKKKEKTMHRIKIETPPREKKSVSMRRKKPHALCDEYLVNSGSLFSDHNSIHKHPNTPNTQCQFWGTSIPRHSLTLFVLILYASLLLLSLVFYPMRPAPSKPIELTTYLEKNNKSKKKTCSEKKNTSLSRGFHCVLDIYFLF